MKKLPEKRLQKSLSKTLPYKRVRETKKEEIINVKEIVNFLRDQNCKDIVALDVTNRCTWASNMIIASGLSKPHLKAVIEDFLKKVKI